LSDVLDEYADWPATLVEFVRWGESRQSLPEALLGGAEICEERARHRGRWFRLAFPTIIFLLIANCVVYSYVALLRPIVESISKLF